MPNHDQRQKSGANRLEAKAKPRRAAPLILALSILPLWQPRLCSQPVAEWATTIPGLTSTFSSLALAPSGEVYAAGWFDYGDGFAATALYKTTPRGEPSEGEPSRGVGVFATAVSPDGSYYLTGRVTDPDLSGMGRHYDFYLGKFAADGSLVWEHTYGTDNNVRTYQQDAQPGYKLAIDSLGFVYVAGRSTGAARFGSVNFPQTPGGPLLCKFAPDGTLIWARRAEGKGLVFGGVQLGGGDAYNLALAPDGTVVISGFMWKGAATVGTLTVTIDGKYDAGGFMAKYDSDGNALWVKPHPAGAEARAIDKRGNIYGAAGEWDTGHSHPAKYDHAGNLIWKKFLSGALTTTDVALDGAGDPVFCGSFSGTIKLDEHTIQNDSDTLSAALVFQTDPEGTVQWALQGLSGGFSSRATAIVHDGKAHVYLAGSVSCPAPLEPCDGVSTLGAVILSPASGNAFVAGITVPTIQRVRLRAARHPSGLALSWPASMRGFVLETASKVDKASWTALPLAPSLQDEENVVTLPQMENQTLQFFRLRKE